MNNIILNENNTKNTDENNATDYYSYLCDKVTKNLHFSKNLEKIDGENMYIPNFNEFNFFFQIKS